MRMENAGAQPSPLQSSVGMVKADITMLVIEARGYAGLMFRQLAREDGNINFSYSRFLEIYFQLYIAFKYNAHDKIDNWMKKEKIFNDMFYNRILKNHEFIPEVLLRSFDFFIEDVIKSGIYNLSSTEFVERGK